MVATKDPSQRVCYHDRAAIISVHTDHPQARTRTRARARARASQNKTRNQSHPSDQEVDDDLPSGHTAPLGEDDRPPLPLQSPSTPLPTPPTPPTTKSSARPICSGQRQLFSALAAFLLARSASLSLTRATEPAHNQRPSLVTPPLSNVAALSLSLVPGPCFRFLPCFLLPSPDTHLDFWLTLHLFMSTATYLEFRF